MGCKPDAGREVNTVSDNDTHSMTLSGSISKWNKPEGDINIMGYFVAPQFSGTIDSKGHLEILLPDDFNNLTASAFAKADSSETLGYALEIPNAQETFANTDGLVFDGATVELALAGKNYGFQVFQRSEYVTTIYPTTSAEFIKQVITPSVNKAITGTYYYFIYSEKPVGIKGNNSTQQLFSNENDESYDLSTVYEVSIKPGWNTLKHEVKEITSSTDAKYSASSRVLISTVHDLPEPMLWVSLASQKTAL